METQNEQKLKVMSEDEFNEILKIIQDDIGNKTPTSGAYIIDRFYETDFYKQQQLRNFDS